VRLTTKLMHEPLPPSPARRVFRTMGTDRRLAVAYGVLWGVSLVVLPIGAQVLSYQPSSVIPPKPLREFRAAWVATVGNIDWPSTNALTTAQQKAELLAILDRAVHLKLNAVILQVRPACDAMYPSTLEPWSEYLTGRMGQAPQPFYDPLALALEEAHRRGLELHAWFNPYRARYQGAKSPVAPNHVSRTKPELVRKYGKFLWLDPGEKEVQDYSLQVVMDVVKRYDIDGVHFDDYFYPYFETNASGSELDFPDEPSWRRYGVGSGLSRADWRRDNVNRFLERVYQSIKAEKPWVKFGISPFGIWRPGNPPQIKGLDAYGKLYADSRKWLASGWLDYCVPQLYWAIDPPQQSFPVLLNWWSAQNLHGRHLYAGLDSTKVNGKWKPEEILNQIRVTRQTAGVGGQVHWGMRSLMRNNALESGLEREVYGQAALVPASTWLPGAYPDKPTLTAANHNGSVTLNWTAAGSVRVWLWLLQTRTNGEWRTEIIPASHNSKAWNGTRPEVVAISAVDRNSNLSAPAVLELAR
jgi:uncharacterized lipoprotein YddW (UPF0748 family)